MHSATVPGVPLISGSRILDEPAVVRAKAALKKQVAHARVDYNAFVEFVMRDERGNQLRQDEVHKVWKIHAEACWELGVYPALMAPFGLGKSVGTVVARAAYEIGRDPNIRIKVICNSDGKAKERVVAIGNILKSTAYRTVFPYVREVPSSQWKKKRPKWTEHMLLVDRKGSSIDVTVQAHGITSTGIGGRADLILFDDVVDRKNAIDEPKTRERILDGFDESWMSRLTPIGRVWYVGNCWHEADLTHALMSRPGWCMLRMPIATNLSCIEAELYNPPEGHPLLAARMDLGLRRVEAFAA